MFSCCKLQFFLALVLTLEAPLDSWHLCNTIFLLFHCLLILSYQTLSSLNTGLMFYLPVCAYSYLCAYTGQMFSNSLQNRIESFLKTSLYYGLRWFPFILQKIFYPNFPCPFHTTYNTACYFVRAENAEEHSCSGIHPFFFWTRHKAIDDVSLTESNYLILWLFPFYTFAFLVDFIFIYLFFFRKDPMSYYSHGLL